MATERSDAPLVSINVPCYRQLPYARRAVQSILSQTFTNFELTLLDDGGSAEYEAYVASLGDARVRYHRNPERLGAMRNMFGAIWSGRGAYTLAFHEDDLLSRGYLSAAVGIMESRPACAFVAGEIHEFETEPPAAALDAAGAYPALEIVGSGADLVRAICRGIEPMFGSVLYRRSALADAAPRHDDLATLVDRPFLLSLLRERTGAILREPLAWYRAAPADDRRHLAMTAEHIVALFRIYKAALPQPLTPQDQALFYGYAGHWLFRLYDLTPAAGRPPFREFLLRAWREGLYQPRWRGRFGLRLIKRAIAGPAAIA